MRFEPVVILFWRIDKKILTVLTRRRAEALFEQGMKIVRAVDAGHFDNAGYRHVGRSEEMPRLIESDVRQVLHEGDLLIILE